MGSTLDLGPLLGKKGGHRRLRSRGGGSLAGRDFADIIWAEAPYKEFNSSHFRQTINNHNQNAISESYRTVCNCETQAASAPRHPHGT